MMNIFELKDILFFEYRYVDGKQRKLSQWINSVFYRNTLLIVFDTRSNKLKREATRWIE